MGRIHDSFARRFPVLVLKKWLTFAPSFTQKSKPLASEYNFLMLCGVRDYQMLRQSLNSIQRNFKALPNLYICTDFGMPGKTISKIKKLYPPDRLHIITAEECMEYHAAKGNNLLIAWAKINPMGLKMAAIIQTSEKGKPLLYADTDILWYNDPANDIHNFSQSATDIHMSYDYHPGYDYNLIRIANLGLTTEKPSYNAGLLFVKSITPQHLSLIEKLLPIILDNHKNIPDNHNNLSEQTIFAYFQKQAGKSEMDPDRYLLFSTDREDIIPTWKKKDAVARHYIGHVRHLFWRDAFFLK